MALVRLRVSKPYKRWQLIFDNAGMSRTWRHFERGAHLDLSTLGEENVSTTRDSSHQQSLLESSEI